MPTHGLMIECILASTARGEIGHEGKIPWELKGDLKRFKGITEGGCVIMGRKTFESLPEPLVNRLNIVVTSRKLAGANGIKDNLLFVQTLTEAIFFAKDRGHERVFVIGGARLYSEALRFADKVHLTLVHKTPLHYVKNKVEGKEFPLSDFYNRPIEYDTVIPDFHLKDYKEVERHGVAYDEKLDDRNLPVVSHTYLTYQREPDTDPDAPIGS